MPLLDVQSLTVDYATPDGRVAALRDVSFSLEKGEALALVGESGSGKSTAALAIIGLLGPEATVSAERISFEGTDLIGLPRTRMRALRGDALGIVFQDPFASLNPALTVGAQVADPLIHHRAMARDAAMARASEAFAEVGLPRPGELLDAYPHQLSGGMQQRVLIAQALICDPRLLILDEPTTALDVTIEAQILDLLDALRRRRGLTMLFITHNLGVVNRICDRACVLYAGSVLEQGPKDLTLGEPLHPYTQGLIGSMARLGAERQDRLEPIPGRFPDLKRLPSGCLFHPRCEFVLDACRVETQVMRPLAGRTVRCWRAGSLPAHAPSLAPIADAPREGAAAAPLLATRDLHKAFPLARRLVFGGPGLVRLERREVKAVDGVTLTIQPGEALGLVGESGSGKSTLGRCIARLIEPSSGHIDFQGHDVTVARGAALHDFRANVQIVFQNPMSSLNPRRRIGATIGRSLDLLGGPRQDRKKRIGELLEAVGLPPDYAKRYPQQLSGGERQRVSIARALASDPKFIVCDEPISALDVSVQATVLNLLADLRDRLKLAYLFISHDLSAVAHIANRVAVMYAGIILEEGRTEDVLTPPFHPYTEALLSAVPSVDPSVAEQGRIRLRGDAGEAGVTGCRFHRRCHRKMGAVCEQVDPPIVGFANGHWIRCHLTPDELCQPGLLPAQAASVPN